MLVACSPSEGRPIGAAKPTPRLVHLRLAGDPRTSIVIAWQADEATTAGVVHFGTSMALAPEGTRHGRWHQVQLRDLAPGTSYTYEVAANGTEHVSPRYTFHTAPDVDVHPDAEIVIGVLGDVHGRLDIWAQLAAELEKRIPDLIIAARDDEMLSEPLVAGVPLIDASSGIDYGFAHISPARNGAIVVRSHDARALIDRGQLARNDAAAVVRVRRGVVSVETIGADGVTRR